MSYAQNQVIVNVAAFIRARRTARLLGDLGFYAAKNDALRFAELSLANARKYKTIK